MIAEYTKAEIDLMIASLIEDIKRSNKRYSCVIGIREGGINVSVLVARALCLPHHSVHISFYEPKHGTGGLVSDDGFKWREGCLVVDDLVDSGRTIEFFKSQFGPADVAVLFWCRDSEEPEYFVQVKPDMWVVFPWEKEDASD